MLNQLGDVVSNKLVRFLQQQAKKDEEKYNKFYTEFGNYIREGVWSDHARSVMET